MGRKIMFTVTVNIEIDEDDWATECGLIPHEVPGDIKSHLTEWVPETLGAAPLGYMFQSVAAHIPHTRYLD